MEEIAKEVPDATRNLFAIWYIEYKLDDMLEILFVVMSKSWVLFVHNVKMIS